VILNKDASNKEHKNEKNKEINRYVKSKNIDKIKKFFDIQN
jgi:hypothetical protein